MNVASAVNLVALAGLASVSVALWTVRVALAARGRKVAGALVASIEAVTFATTFAGVLASIDSPVRLAAYAAGVAAGTWVGMQLEDLLATGRGPSPPNA
jgi:uncharacterized protein YebE (UPF0316 family)